MNIVRYDGKEHFDYAKYWVADDINIFIGGRGTGKSYSIAKHEINCGEYEYAMSSFIRYYKGYNYPYSIMTVPYAGGVILSFISLCDFQKWYSSMCDNINSLIKMTEIKLSRRF